MYNIGPSIDEHLKKLQRYWRWPDLSEEEKAAEMQQLHLPYFWSSIECYIERAIHAAYTRASSYRNFAVGCLAYAFRSRPQYLLRSPYKSFLGSNMKPVSDGPNVCAEMAAIQAARHEGYDLIVGLVITGEPQEDHQSRLVTPTLHPCGKCRTIMASLPEMRPDTLIVTAHLESDDYEAHYFDEILKLHNHGCEK